MKRWLGLSLLGSLLFSAEASRAQDSDPWWGKDKALHFAVSIGLGAGGYAGASLWLDPKWQRATAGAGFSLTLGAGKELYDLSGHGNPSWRDFTWDVAGTAVGVLLAWLLDSVLFESAAESRANTQAFRTWNHGPIRDPAEKPGSWHWPAHP